MRERRPGDKCRAMKSGKDQQKSGKAAGRDQRLAAALRENLRRRKAQERGRGASGPASSPSEPDPPSDDEKIR